MSFCSTYDYQQAKCKDSELIQAWFQHVQATFVKYSIHKNNIYNFDETDFQMSIISTAKVITESIEQKDIKSLILWPLWNNCCFN